MQARESDGRPAYDREKSTIFAPNFQLTMKSMGTNWEFLAWAYYFRAAERRRPGYRAGYSHFWRGDKITASRVADFTYVQWELNF